MIELELCFEDGTFDRRTVGLPLEIGRTPECGLQIKAFRVARRHARIERRDGSVFIEDFGALSGTRVNGQRVTQYGPLHAGDEILIGPCLMRVQGFTVVHAQEDSLERPCEGDHAGGGVRVLDLKTTDEHAANALKNELYPILRHRRRLHAALLEALDLRRRDIANMSDDALRSEAMAVMTDIIALDTELPASVNRQELVVDVVNEAVGLGPLEPLLADPKVTEIMVNRHDEVFVEIEGRLCRFPTAFSSEQAVLGVIERIVSPLGRRIDESSPMVDARLRDGSRVNAVISPVALRGASLTIRKFPHSRPGMADLLRLQALDASMSEFLSACVSQRKNLIVSGGTGSGKTTLLNILSNSIPVGERIVTIEDAAELRLDHEHLVSLEARPPNLEGRGKIDIRELVRNALRMRPDRIVVGECRGGEAFDMLAAMNTGHEGSLTTLHANTPRDALSRLETMILMAGMDIPLAAVREHIAASINIIVQQARRSNGKRLVTSIVEVTGIESGRIQIQELFRYQVGPPAAFIGCGAVPECFTDDAGVSALPLTLFHQKTMVDHGSVNGTATL
ncbi:MAG TPA: ATPase, T2SS/T4P/T4SS family [Candidimonas sp.]|nr:ATPase, T2SS/T4P/T4SS family [Candidimonas sp.]